MEFDCKNEANENQAFYIDLYMATFNLQQIDDSVVNKPEKVNRRVPSYGDLESG